MLRAAQGLGNPGYGLLYAVPASYYYLLTVNTALSIPFVGTIRSGLWTVVLLLLSLYATIWIHRVSVLIFGTEAGLESTRSKEVSRKHFVYFISGVEPSDLPDTASVIPLASTAFEIDDLNWEALLRAIPAGPFMLYLLIAWAALTALLYSTGGSLVAGGLWLILTILAFRDWIIGYLPDHIPAESVDRIDEPEYIRTRREISNKDKNHKRPRIRPENSPSSPMSSRTTNRGGETN